MESKVTISESPWTVDSPNDISESIMRPCLILNGDTITRLIELLTVDGLTVAEVTLTVATGDGQTFTWNSVPA
jgi:hypothetical protein